VCVGEKSGNVKKRKREKEKRKRGCLVDERPPLVAVQLTEKDVNNQEKRRKKAVFSGKGAPSFPLSVASNTAWRFCRTQTQQISGKLHG